MNLFKSKPKLNPDRKIIPLLSIRQHFEIYRENILAPHTSGTNGATGEFEEEVKVILESQGLQNQGISLRCGHYLLMVCVSGRAVKRQNQHTFSLEPRTVHLVSPGDIYSLEDAAEDYREHILMFSSNCLSAANLPEETMGEFLTMDPGTSPRVGLTSEEFRQWDNLFRQLGQEMRSKQHYFDHIVRNLILHLLYLVKRVGPSEPSFPRASRKLQLYDRFTDLVETHFYQMKSVYEYAELLSLTPKHLSETVKEVSGHTALFFIQDRIVRESKYLLVYTSLNVKQIATKLNFETPSHFVRFFKHLSGYTPLKFKQYQLNS